MGMASVGDRCCVEFVDMCDVSGSSCSNFLRGACACYCSLVVVRAGCTLSASVAGRGWFGDLSEAFDLQG